MQGPGRVHVAGRANGSDCLRQLKAITRPIFRHAAIADVSPIQAGSIQALSTRGPASIQLTRVSSSENIVGVDTSAPVAVDIVHTRPRADPSVGPASTSGRSSDVSIAHVLAREVGLTRDQAAWMLTNWPALMEVSPGKLRSAIKSLCQFTGCSKAQAAAMLLKQHELLHTQVSTLEQKAAALGTALGIPSKAVAEVLPQAPSLLQEDPAAVKSRLSRMSKTLEAPFTKVVAAALEEPWLLKATPQDLSTHVRALTKRLGQEQAQVLQLVLAHPHLLAMSEATLTAKIYALCEVLKVKPDSARELVCKHPAILAYSSQRMKDHVAALTAVVPHESLQAMVFKEASLLTRSHTTILRNLTGLKTVLACSAELALDLVARRPSLLTCSPAAISSSFRAMSVWKFSAQEKRELITHHPLLLRLSPAEVHGRCRWLRTLMMSNGYYHACLREMPMQLLGVLLMHLPTAWGRLQYLADSSQEASCDMMRVVQSSAAAFAKKYPEYDKWLAWKCGEMGGNLPWKCKPKSSKARQGQKAGDRKAAQAHSSDHNGAAPGKPAACTAPAPAPGAAGAAPAPASSQPPELTTVVHEARTMKLGLHIVRKPRRVEQVPKLEQHSVQAAANDESEGGEDAAPKPASVQT